MRMTTADYAAAHLEFLARCGRVTHVVHSLAGRISLSLQAQIAQVVEHAVPLGDGRVAVVIAAEIPPELAVLPVKVAEVNIPDFRPTPGGGSVPEELMTQIIAIKHSLSQVECLKDRIDLLEHVLSSPDSGILAADQRFDRLEDAVLDLKAALTGQAVVPDDDDVGHSESAPMTLAESMSGPAGGPSRREIERSARESEMLDAVAALLAEKRLVAPETVHGAA